MSSLQRITLGSLACILAVCIFSIAGAAWGASASPPTGDSNWDPRFPESNGLAGLGFELSIIGTDVYAAGRFTSAGPVTANNIAKWDSIAGTWSSLGTGTSNGVDNDIIGMAVSGTDVYVGGRFTTAGGLPASRVAKWDTLTGTWSALGSGPNNGPNGDIYALTVVGSTVYVGGQFSSAGGVPANNIAKWDGSAWSSVGDGSANGVNATVWGLAAGGGNVYAGGDFTAAGGAAALHIAKWDGSAWSPFIDDSQNGTNGTVNTLTLSGSNLYVGGNFTTAGSIFANNIALWNGSAWSPLAGGVGNAVYVIAVSGNDVYVGGFFRTPGPYIARWDGSAWFPMGPRGLSNSAHGIGVIGGDVYVDGFFVLVGNSLPSYHFGIWHNPNVTPTPGVTNTQTVTCTPIGTQTEPAVMTYTFTPTATITPTRIPTQCIAGYAYATATGTIVPSTTDTGNHGDDVVTSVSLPFPFAFYGVAYNTVKVSSNGNLQFATDYTDYANVCLPWGTVRPRPAIFPFWDDLSTDYFGTCTGGCGIYTSISGSSPNRIFNIEWRTYYFGGSGNAYFEIRLYEGSNNFDLVIGTVDRNNSATTGVQKDETNFTQYQCNTSIGNNLKITFTLRDCGTATPSPIPTRGTQTPTYTPTPTSIVTPNPTDTPCAITFSDVNPSDFFYVPVQYLACRGIVSGYADNTFRPYNNTRRGQLSKIVVLAEGWQLECPSTQHFTDVDATNPFYCYIETAFAHGIISGYSDGTFRPDNDVTRAQLCKIVVLAEGWWLICPPSPHFVDVPVIDPFYCYIETAYGHAVISGYNDSTFRPYNHATRGQICKIVYLAITGP